ncbi:hypothetical protein [Streptomyces sp. NPDC048720]|uniref:hypothetical protein n=1 Tax=Streptomyces sp. NPDC048720 TaxID=3365588 RepID=UPI003711278E
MPVGGSDTAAKALRPCTRVIDLRPGEGDDTGLPPASGARVTYRVPGRHGQQVEAEGRPASLTDFPLGQWIADAKRSTICGNWSRPLPPERQDSQQSRR